MISDHETKYVLDAGSAPRVIEWLKLRCRPDPSHPCETISSIYYDTPDWRFLREKVNSDFLKTKVRLRWYSDVNDRDPSEVSFAEAKFRSGSLRRKIRVKTEYTGEWIVGVSLADPLLLSVRHLLGTEGFPSMGLLLPVFQVSYVRDRLLDPLSGMTVCVDSRIRAPRVNPQMVPRANPFSLRKAVVELKGDGQDLPTLLRSLCSLGCRRSSFSKYMSCYSKIMDLT